MFNVGTEIFVEIVSYLYTVKTKNSPSENGQTSGNQIYCDNDDSMCTFGLKVEIHLDIYLCISERIRCL